MLLSPDAAPRTDQIRCESWGDELHDDGSCAKPRGEELHEDKLVAKTRRDGRDDGIHRKGHDDSRKEWRADLSDCTTDAGFGVDGSDAVERELGVPRKATR